MAIGRHEIKLNDFLYHKTTCPLAMANSSIRYYNYVREKGRPMRKFYFEDLK